MNKKIFAPLLIFAFAFLAHTTFAQFSAMQDDAVVLPGAPTIITPAAEAYVTSSLPEITALAHTGTRVAVYIDDVFNGYATHVSEGGGVQSVVYTPFLPLRDGEHTLMMRAEDVERDIRSEKSAVTTFAVERTLPAPTVMSAVVNTASTNTQPFITGVAPSGTTVDVYIDSTYNGSIAVGNHPSGTGSFAYRPFLPLSIGQHTAAARATTIRMNGSKRYSEYSQLFQFSVRGVAAEPAQSGTISVAESQKKETTEQREDPNGQEPTPGNQSQQAEEGKNVEDQDQQVDGGLQTPLNIEYQSAPEDITPAVAEPVATWFGWVLLLIAAVIVGVQLQKRRQNDRPKSQGEKQLELRADDDAQHVQLVERTEATTEDSRDTK